MSILVWDAVGERTFETGLDRGVLYLPEDVVVPWNGLISVVEKFDKETTPVYYDGMKINELVTLGHYAASMKAITYPDEFAEFEGLGRITGGLYFGEQPSTVFGLSYRVKVGNDLDNENAGYKIHLLYNVTAIPLDRTYTTVAEDVELVDFEWDITAVPEEVPGFRPTAHVIIDSRHISPDLLEELEGLLYGSDTTVPSLIPIFDLLGYLNNDYKWSIVDGGNGLWSASTPQEELIEYDVDDPDMFTLYEVNASFISADTYVISDELYSEEP